MKKIAVVGAGHIGSTIAALLSGAGDYEILVIDRDQAALARIEPSAQVSTKAVDVAKSGPLRDAIAGAFAVISAAPYQLTTVIAKAAVEAGVHYLDLTEDVASTHEVERLAEGAGKAFIPQCGLAPGFVSIVAFDFVRRFDKVMDMALRVGALPQYPSNALGYNLTWSTDGLIHEYCEPCEAIVEGKLRMTTPLQECETLAIDGVTYEAFNTSGGLGTLCKTLEGKVRNLNYRTMRYPGHVAIMKTLLNDLRLRDDTALLKTIFERALPQTEQDVVVIFVTVSGERGGRLIQETFTRKVYAQRIDNRPYSAIQVTTAGGACAVLDLLAQGELPQAGFVRLEQVRLDKFLQNRFGRYYAAASSPT
ncbi:MAG: saccharopine dehydrogenase family protein [Proteobacteria bacterium]|nr:saccharopine dehydrogenase family protein [Pseudomonadota bacterium]